MDLDIPLVPNLQGFSITIDGVVYRTLRRNANDQLLVAVAAPFTPTSIVSGQSTTSVGHPLTLPDNPCRAASIAARPMNTDNVCVGPGMVSMANGRLLAPGESIDIAIDNLNRLSLNVNVNNEGISWLVVND